MSRSSGLQTALSVGVAALLIVGALWLTQSPPEAVVDLVTSPVEPVSRPVVERAPVVAPAQSNQPVAVAPETRIDEVPESVPQPAGIGLDALRIPDEAETLLPRMRQHEAVFAAQPTDPAWSIVTETQILREVSQAAARLEIDDVQVECRTTLCRMQFAQPLGALGDFSRPGGPLAAIADALDLEQRVLLAAYDGEGTPVTIAYYGRADLE